MSEVYEGIFGEGLFEVSVGLEGQKNTKLREERMEFLPIFQNCVPNDFGFFG